MTENPFQSPMADCSKLDSVDYESRSPPDQSLLHRAALEAFGVFVGLVCAAIEVGMIYLIVSDDMVGTLGYMVSGLVFLGALCHLAGAFYMANCARDSFQCWRQR